VLEVSGQYGERIGPKTIEKVSILKKKGGEASVWAPIDP